MLMERFQASERKACALVGLSRAVWRYHPQERDDEGSFRAQNHSTGLPACTVDMAIAWLPA